ncbi:ABC transporter ATP-binding protein [Salimicrobium album]|uniref:ABC transport system ATP-binding protein n=1 Tax=Salimicrobium album TaxID=50717 RepID=A0A1H3ITF9_9BACI|nr:ABC transporter ATP-binding protein [Salimicrobium album]SDY31043.1 putative ABC transport system ATP-binding protein [Salimicrobium album]
MLEINKVSKVYGGKIAHRALTDVSLEVEDGEFVGIMGPSGSGKTTLLNLISTIDEPTNGEVKINGENPHGLKKQKLAEFRRRSLGFIFQDFNLLPTLSIEENIVLPLTLEGEKVKEMEKKSLQIARKLGIEEILNKRITEVSGGQAQRAAIARAMIHAPSLLLADEPTGNLDSKSSKDVMELLEAMNKEEKMTTLLVTHDPQAASYCDRVVFIRDGKFYSEIHRGEKRQPFFQQIMDTLAFLGGEHDDLSTVRHS